MSKRVVSIIIIVVVGLAMVVTPVMFLIFRGESEPEPAPVSTPSDQAGWQTFEGSGVGISLPDNYVGGTKEQMSELAEVMRAEGPEYSEMADTFEQNKELFLFWAYDPEAAERGFGTNVNITTEQLPSGVTLGDYMNAARGSIPAESTILDAETVQLGDYEVGRMDIESDFMDIKLRQVLYVIIEGGKVYVISCSASAEEFDQVQGVFDQAAASFRVL